MDTDSFSSAFSGSAGLESFPGSDAGYVPSPREAAATIEVPDLPDLGPGAAPTAPRDLRLLSDVQVELSVELGRVRLPLRELLGLQPGSVLELDRAADAPVDVLVNGHTVARGEVVVLDGEFGVRITAVLTPDA